MVTELGMTVSQGPPESAPLAQPTGDYALSDQTRREVDVHAQELAHMAYARARRLMKLNRQCLDDLASNALERETLTREDLDEIFAAHELRRRLDDEHDVEVEEESPERRFTGPGALLPQRSTPKEPEEPS
jgi:cell division protease FtsH